MLAIEDVTDDALLGVDLAVLAAGLPAASDRSSKALNVPLGEGLARRRDGGIRYATLSEWLRSMPNTYAAVALFDVRPSTMGVFSPRPSRAILRELRRHEFEVVAKPESFRVSHRRFLFPGEAERAEAWGRLLGSTARRVSRY